MRGRRRHGTVQRRMVTPGAASGDTASSWLEHKFWRLAVILELVVTAEQVLPHPIKVFIDAVMDEQVPAVGRCTPTAGPDKAVPAAPGRRDLIGRRQSKNGTATGTGDPWLRFPFSGINSGRFGRAINGWCRCSSCIPASRGCRRGCSDMSPRRQRCI